MHQVTAFFLHRLSEGLQAGGFDRLRGGGEFRVHRGAAPSGLSGVVKDVKLNLGGHALERLEDIGVLHVIDGNIQRMFSSPNELDKLRNGFAVDLGALGLEEKAQTRRTKRRDTGHGKSPSY